MLIPVGLRRGLRALHSGDYYMKKIDTEAFTEWLDGFIDFKRNLHKNVYNLEKMKKFAAFFGNPQTAYTSLHVAGSKGKGSVSAMLASILNEAGFKAGLFTSPHVTDFRERITCAGRFFSDAAYSAAYQEIIEGFQKIIEEDPSADPGWFEIVTAAALLLFKKEGVNAAVLETGMGGRLDMTNIVVPAACILTPIELEHCKFLGSTLGKIAFEKAGIIKQNVPVFCSRQEKEALSVFQKRAAEMNAPFFYLPETVQHIEAAVSSETLDLTMAFYDKTPAGKLFTRPLKTRLRLLDKVQSENAALAACTAKYLFPELKEDVIERGLSKAWLPARFEILLKNPLIVTDGAHTKNSILLCLKTFFELTDKKGLAVFACADDKDTKEIAPLFKSGFRKIVLTIPGTFKKSNLDSNYADFQYALKNLPVEPTKIEAITIGKNEDYKSVIEKSIAECKKNNEPLLIIGSFYLAAEAKTIYGKTIFP